MLKKWIAGAMALLMLAAPALGESDEVARLQARVEELEAENAELRQLLSQEESARLLAARFDGGVITVSEARAEYDYLAYYYEQLGMDPDDHEDTIKNEVLSNLTEDAILTLKAQELGVYAPSAEEEAEIRARAQASLDEMVDYYLAYQADPAKSDEENRAAVLEFLAGEGTTLESVVTPDDITGDLNPNGLEFYEANAELIPGLRGDVAFAIINGNNAALAGLNPNTAAAYAETADSLAGQSYVNVFAVKPENAEADFVKALESCVYTQKVYDLIVERGFVPTFTVEAAE